MSRPASLMLTLCSYARNAPGGERVSFVGASAAADGAPLVADCCDEHATSDSITAIQTHCRARMRIPPWMGGYTIAGDGPTLGTSALQARNGSILK
jgi:hypothetical protein